MHVYRGFAKCILLPFAALDISMALFNLVTKFEHLSKPTAQIMSLFVRDHENAANVSHEIIRYPGRGWSENFFFSFPHISLIGWN